MCDRTIAKQGVDGADVDRDAECDIQSDKGELDTPPSGRASKPSTDPALSPSTQLVRSYR